MNKETELKPCREAFEAWAADYYRMKNFSRDMDYDGSYIQPINNEWEAWQAAQAQLQAENADLKHKLMLHATMLDEKDMEIMKLKAALQHNEAAK